MSYDVIVIGSFVMALTTRLPRMPHAGESLIADLLDVGPGGKGSNLAVAVARQGKRVGLVAKVGDDLFSGAAFELWRKEGIATDHVKRTGAEQTGVALIYLDHAGQNRIGVYPGANTLLSREDVFAIEPHIGDARVLAIQLEIGDEAVQAAVDLGRAHGLTVLLNPAPARRLPAEILAKVDILTPNEGESRMLLGLSADDPISHEDVGRRLLDLGPRTVIITLGEQGALIVQRDAPALLVPAYPVNAIDTVGAGDAFSGGLCVALSDRKPLAEAARWAAITAAIAVTHIGAIPGLPDRKAVEQRYGNS